MSAIGALDGSAPRSIAIAGMAKQQEQVEQEGRSALKLLDSAAGAGREANADPERGRLVDVQA